MGMLFFCLNYVFCAIVNAFQAEDGIGLPEEVLNDSSFDRAAKLYFIYIRFDWVWSLNLFALLLLNFLEVSCLFCHVD